MPLLVIPFFTITITPFAILHVDFLIPGHHTDSNSYMALINVMCDISQFVVIVPVPDESSTTLTSYFIQYVLLKFGLRHLIVLDDGISFNICKAFYLKHNVLTKHNHRGLTVESFHRFFNKSVTIPAEERDTNDIFSY